MNKDDYLRFRLAECFNDFLKDIRNERQKYTYENAVYINEYLQENMEELILDKETKQKDPLYCVAQINFDDVPKDKLTILAICIN